MTRVVPNDAYPAEALRKQSTMASIKVTHKQHSLKDGDIQNKADVEAHTSIDCWASPMELLLLWSMCLWRTLGRTLPCFRDGLENGALASAMLQWHTRWRMARGRW